MSVKPHPTKAGHWTIDCRPDGYAGGRIRETYKCADEEDAISIEQHLMGRDNTPTAITPRKISEIYNLWLPVCRGTHAPGSVIDVMCVWKKNLNKHFGRIQPAYLSRAVIDAYKASRVTEGVKPTTVNKELSHLKSMLKWAVEGGLCKDLPLTISLFPAKMVKAPIPRPLSQAQVTAIYQHLPERLWLPFLLMADAGLRVTEALTLQRSNVEFDSEIIIVRGKGNKERIVPITTDRLKVELEKRRELRGGYLSANPRTGKPYAGIRCQILTAAKKAGIDKHVYHHLLRHSFGTNATAASYDLSALQWIMGHSKAETTGKYQHLAAVYLREQGRKMNDMIENTVHMDTLKTTSKP